MPESNNQSVFRVLIIKPSSLGDVLHALPAAAVIKNKYPDAVVDWLVSPQFLPVLEFQPVIRKKILFRRKELGRFFSFLPSFIRLAREIRSEKYDVVIDMQGLHRSAFLAWLARAKVRAGFAKTREKTASLFYNRKIEIPADKVHAAEKNICLVCGALGIPFEMPSWIPPGNEAARVRLEKILKENGIQNGKRFIGVVPGARWKSKQWPPEFFASVIRGLASDCSQSEFVLLGAGDDSFAASAIMKTVGKEAVIHDLTGKTDIAELVELIRKCAAVFCNDSGPMHIAAALGVPVFALFGPTDPDKTGPYGKFNEIFIANKGCIKCMRRYCLDGSYDCHSGIDVQTVVARMVQFLKKCGEK